MLEHLIEFISRLGDWGYLVIFLGAMLEAAAFLGLVVLGESIVLVGGFFAAQGMLDVGDLIFVVAVGAIIGDSIGYELGRRLGRDWLLRYGCFVGLREHHLKRADDFFTKHGGKTIFIGRFVGFLRALAPFIAGSSKMPYRRFLIYNAAGGILWSIIIVLLGYFFGASWHRAEAWIGRASAIVGGIILLVILLVWLWRQLVSREDEIKEGWQAFLENPRVLAFRCRFAPQLAFLRERFSPANYLGLNLTVGVIILVGAGWLFGGIAEDVVNNDLYQFSCICRSRLACVAKKLVSAD